MTQIHVCQDDFGQWFITREATDGSLELVHHADRYDSALHDAQERAERDGATLHVEKPHRADVQEAGYRPPVPRRARV